jgi:hypothetical protein
MLAEGYESWVVDLFSDAMFSSQCNLQTVHLNKEEFK